MSRPRGAAPAPDAADAAPRLVGAVAWVVAVAATPRAAVWAFGLHAAIVTAVIVHTGTPWRRLRRGLALDAPFAVFALALPVLGPAPRTEIAGLSLSTEGLWGMWGILAKATLGVLVALTFLAPVPVPHLLRGLEQLRVPRVLVAITAMTVRSLHLLTDDLDRMRIARTARGSDPRWLWQSRAIAAGAGTLFVRSHERGERVHLAMVSRGYAGTMPRLDAPRARAGRVIVVLTPAIAAAVVAGGARLVGTA